MPADADHTARTTENTSPTVSPRVSLAATRCSWPSRSAPSEAGARLARLPRSRATCAGSTTMPYRLTTATAVGRDEITSQNAAPDATRPSCCFPCWRATAWASPVLSARRGSRRSIKRGGAGRQRVGRGRADPPEGVAIQMVDRAGTIRHVQRRVLLVRPRVVTVDGDPHAEGHGAERGVEERVREDAVHLRTEGGADLELGCVGLGSARGEEHLAAGDGERVQHRAGGGFPEPIADLVVESLHLTGLDDVRVVAQPV